MSSLPPIISSWREGSSGETELKLKFVAFADLWVFSTLLKLTTEQASEHAIYDPAKSSTAKALQGETWDIS